MVAPSVYDRDVFAAIKAAVEEPLEVDDALRAAVVAIVEELPAAWAGILFVEDGDLVLGPEAGEQQSDARVQVPVVYRGERIAELVVDAPGDADALPAIADLLAEYCLVGWDTGGIPWEAVE